MRETIFLILILALFFAGCSTSLNYARKMTPGMPPDFQLGYAHGCDSGYAAAGNPYYRFNQDYYLFKNNEEYRDGWKAGYDACKTSYSNLTNMF